MNNQVQHWQSKWTYLYALVAGGLSVFAFSPFDFYPAIFLSSILFFYTLSCATTVKQHFLLSWMFGVGLFGAGASWPFYSMYFFAHAPLPIAVTGTLLFVIIVALFSCGLFGLLAAQFRHFPILSRLALFYPASWVFIEWTRTWLFTGFPWLYFGNSLIDTIFSSYAPLLGVFGVSLVCMVMAGAFVVIIRKIVEKRSPDKKQLVSIVIIIFFVTSSFLLQNINWIEKKGEALTVSVLQANISQLEKLDPNKLGWMLEQYKEMTLQSLDSDLIVWPETALFARFDEYMDSLIVPLQKQLKQGQGILIGGFYINQQRGVENSVLAISSEFREIYSKRHLVPFGEYIPFIEYIRWMGDWIPYSNITAGKNNGTLSIAGELAQMTICYEDAFGAEIIQSLPEATMLINVTHDGWFTGSIQPAQHMQIARMRSLETGRYMIRATTTGPAGIIDEKGNVIATAPQYTKKIITHEVQPFTGSTPYVRWGNWLLISLLMTILSIGILRNRQVRRKNGNP